ncbi:MAG: AAA family ATPase, partial [Candidatus Nanopelagicales bacterium]
MIEELRITNLGVVANSELKFGPGLNVLTGETGAGKTMIINALNLSLGAKADLNLVREAATKLTVESSWRLSKKQREVISEILDEETEEELFLGKSIDRAGKSRALLNGLVSTNSQINEIADQIIQVFGQNDQRFLLQPQWQLRSLDEFGGESHLVLLLKYQDIFREYQNLSKKLTELKAQRINWAESVAQMQTQLAEFDAIDPSVNEDEEILVRISQREEIEATLDELKEIGQLISSDTGDALLTKLKQLSSLINRLDNFTAYRDDLTALINTVNEIERELLAAMNNADDGVTLSDLYSRKAALANLIRKHGLPLSEIATKMNQSRELLNSSFDPSAEIERIERELISVQGALLKTSKQLSKARIESSERLSQFVTAELVQLKMPGIRFVVSVIPRVNGGEIEIDKFALDVTGGDSVEFQIGHGDGVPRGIAKSASGGELSRIMLALQVVLQDRSSDKTFIFDEVDAGVVGEAAIE